MASRPDSEPVVAEVGERCPACRETEVGDDGFCRVCKADSRSPVWRETVPAYLGVRFLAAVVDHVVALGAGQAAVAAAMSSWISPARTVPLIALNLLVFSGYFALFTGFFGATPGKLLFRLSVRRRVDGRRADPLRAILRETLGRLLCMFLAPVGYLPALTIPRARTLADLVSGTVVVRRRK